MWIVWLSVLFSLIGFGFAIYLAWILLKQKVENKTADIIASYIHKGAITFLIKEYKVLGVFVLLLAIIMFIMPAISFKIAIAFLTGAVFSAMAGFIGMKIATVSNVRTAEKCKHSIHQGLQLAFYSGSVMSLSVVALGLLGIALLYIIFRDTDILYGFGLGASLVALFARVGGGIYTKAADVGADLVGKVEAGIPEDDIRNPAVIADSVGDNVGDVSGMGADLFESYVDSIIVAMALGVAFLPLFGSRAIVLPLLLAGFGILAAIAGIFVVKFSKAKPRQVLNRGVWTASALVMVASFFIIRYLLGSLEIFQAMLSGLIAGIIVGLTTEYYTSDRNKPTQELATSSKFGSALDIISGLSLGFVSTVIPVLAVVITIYITYNLSGLYGVAIAAVGMLSTLGTTLATNAYGPVADNAAAISEMASMGSEIRERARELDSVGNTTAAVGKGLAIGSAALTSMALLFAYAQSARLTAINLMNINTAIGLFIGGVLPFLFSALLIKSVSKGASKIITEVRRQFKHDSGIMDGTNEPDYNRCVDVSTGAALRQMIIPGFLAILTPVIIGLWLGVESLAGMLAGSVVVGFLLAVMMANAGGAWDNAKKYIEEDHLGGVGSDIYRAAVVGDTVGDPLKDTAGPALNILIKLMAIVSLIIVPLLF